MAAVCQNGNSLRFASPEIQDDDEVVLAATREDPHALNYASERIKNDKNFVRQVCQFNVYSLSHASKRLLNDREYMLSLMHGHIFTAARHSLMTRLSGMQQSSATRELQDTDDFWHPDEVRERNRSITF